MGAERFALYVSQDSDSTPVSDVVSSFASTLAIHHLRKGVSLEEEGEGSSVKIASHYKYGLVSFIKVLIPNH